MNDKLIEKCLLTDEELYDLNADITEAADDGDVYQWERFICEAQDLKSKRKLVEWGEEVCSAEEHAWSFLTSTVHADHRRRRYCAKCWQQLKEGLEEP